VQSRDGQILLSPSDLNDHVECPHFTTLALEVVRGQRARPQVPDEEAELLRRKGEAHERAHLERLRAEGRAIVEIELGDPWDFEAAARRTAEAMRAGAEVISQATFVDGRWRGRADFLLRIERQTRLGSWGYEPLDLLADLLIAEYRKTSERWAKIHDLAGDAGRKSRALRGEGFSR
jgi:uncharacterized protein